MKKTTFLMIMATLLTMHTTISQNGNKIDEVIPIDGTGLGVNFLDYDSATPSNLSPLCANSEDVFYKHTISQGDNRLTIGMVSAGTTLFTEIDYQILKAPNGDTGNLIEVTCDKYEVLLIVGGSFQTIIKNVNSGDDYYLRVFKPSGVGGFLNSLLNGTSVTMISDYDSTLSIGSDTQSKLQVFVNDNQIRLGGNTLYDAMKIFSLGGKQIMYASYKANIETIDISSLQTGMYILTLHNNEGSKEIKKFIKR